MDHVINIPRSGFQSIIKEPSKSEKVLDILLLLLAFIALCFVVGGHIFIVNHTQNIDSSFHNDNYYLEEYF